MTKKKDETEPMKTFVFDVDDSLSTIGGPETVAKTFGMPPIRITKGFAQLGTAMKFVAKKKMVPFEHPLVELTESERNSQASEVWELTDKAKELGLEILVVDSFTQLCKNERDIITDGCDPNKRGMKVMDKMDWQYYGSRLLRTITMLRKIPLAVVCTAHIDHTVNESTGVVIDVPAVKGSSKFELPQYFDIVVYANITMDEEQTTFSWQTKPSQARPLAKDRLHLLPTFMPMDLGFIIRAYKNAGFEYPKVLIIADTGQGKTASLKTINVAYDKAASKYQKKHASTQQKEPDNATD